MDTFSLPWKIDRGSLNFERPPPQDSGETPSSGSQPLHRKGGRHQISFDIPPEAYGTWLSPWISFPLKWAASLGTVSALVVGYALSLQVVAIGNVTSIGCYGVAILVDYLLQLFCAMLNRFSVEHLVARKQADNRRAARANLADGGETGQAVATSISNVGNEPLLCPDGVVAMVAVGYREDEAAWADCLRSLRKQTLKARMIITVVDGNAPEDMPMANAFAEVFKDANARIVDLPLLLSAEHRRIYETLEEKRRELGPKAASLSFRATAWRWLLGTYTPEQKFAHQVAYSAAVDLVLQWKEDLHLTDDLDAICFTQPHGHKRTAMFTGFCMAMQVFHITDGIFTTDSDTLVEKHALDELLCLLRSDDTLGGVTGEVKIWNAGTSWLTRICMVRYWMAFNVERGCQSIWRCVACLSGPMAMYRVRDLNNILGRWNVQEFGGVETTFGDDRHMTNQLLATGRRTRHTHRTWCDSESPEKFVRFIRQQTRWSKSYFHEVFWFPAQYVLHSWWLLFEAVKQAMFPFILMGTLFHMFFTPTSPWRPLVWFGTIILAAFLKALVACIVARDPWMLAFVGYGFVYFFGLLPTKVWALCTLKKNAWGTSARSAGELKKGESFRTRSFHVGYLCLWFAMLSTGLSYYIAGILKNDLFLLMILIAVSPSIAVYVDDWPAFWRAVFTCGGVLCALHPATLAKRFVAARGNERRRKAAATRDREKTSSRASIDRPLPRTFGGVAPNPLLASHDRHARPASGADADSASSTSSSPSSLSPPRGGGEEANMGRMLDDEGRELASQTIETRKRNDSRLGRLNNGLQTLIKQGQDALAATYNADTNDNSEDEMEAQKSGHFKERL